MVQRTKSAWTGYVEPIWPFDDVALARAGQVWFEAGEEIQRSAMEYAASRITKDSEALGRLASCTSPLELIQVQADYARDAFGDLVENGRRVVACVEEATRKTAPGTQ